MRRAPDAESHCLATQLPVKMVLRSFRRSGSAKVVGVESVSAFCVTNPSRVSSFGAQDAVMGVISTTRWNGMCVLVVFCVFSVVNFSDIGSNSSVYVLQLLLRHRFGTNEVCPTGCGHRCNLLKTYPPNQT